MTTDMELFKLIVTGSPGAAALSVILWMVIKEFPEMRRQREALNDRFFAECAANRLAVEEEGRANREALDKLSARYEASINSLMLEFRKEIAAERAGCAAERLFDREVRKELSSLLGGRIEALTEAVNKSVTHSKQLASAAAAISASELTKAS